MLSIDLPMIAEEILGWVVWDVESRVVKREVKRDVKREVRSGFLSRRSFFNVLECLKKENWLFFLYVGEHLPAAS